MAAIVLGAGFKRTPEQEIELRKAAADLPDDWDISMAGHLGSEMFTVRVDRGSGIWQKGFAADGIVQAIRWLQALKPRPSA